MTNSITTTSTFGLTRVFKNGKEIGFYTFDKGSVRADFDNRIVFARTEQHAIDLICGADLLDNDHEVTLGR